METAAGDMYLPADSLGLTAQIATPISLPGGIAGPIVFGQSLRTSRMVGPATVGPAHGPAAAACSAAVAFVDAARAVIQSSTVSVQPGQSLPYDLVWSDSRVQIRATVEVPPVVPPAGSSSRCPAISSQRSRPSIPTRSAPI